MFLTLNERRAQVFLDLDHQRLLFLEDTFTQAVATSKSFRATSYELLEGA